MSSSGSPRPSGRRAMRRSSAPLVPGERLLACVTCARALRLVLAAAACPAGSGSRARMTVALLPAVVLSGQPRRQQDATLEPFTVQMLDQRASRVGRVPQLELLDRVVPEPPLLQVAARPRALGLSEHLLKEFGGRRVGLVQ